MSSRLQRIACCLCLLLAAVPVLAHHSYADYDRAERFELRGILTEIHWGNPHIILMIRTDSTDMRIEWITLTGADKTAVSKDQLAVGDAVIVIGSRNKNPDRQIMTLVKELQIPLKHFQWKVPSSTGARPESAFSL